MKRVRATRVLLSLVLGLGVAGLAHAGQQGHFPTAGMDVMTHKITVGLYQVKETGERGELLETLDFKGRMLIERGDPFVNEQLGGRRQIEFFVKSWEAQAWSNKLNTLVVYKLSDVDQKPSTITAQQKGADFPAAIHFRVTFDASAYDTVFDPIHEGTPDGEGFMEVPPSGNRRTSPTITKFDATRIEMDHPTLGRLLLHPIDCNDETGETLVTFTDAQKKLLKLGAGPAKPNKDSATR